jgi:hypothetical protein
MFFVQEMARVLGELADAQARASSALAERDALKLVSSQARALVDSEALQRRLDAVEARIGSASIEETLNSRALPLPPQAVGPPESDIDFSPITSPPKPPLRHRQHHVRHHSHGEYVQLTDSTSTTWSISLC